MGRTVWLVEDGSYSDYHVIGVYSTKANAEFITRHCGGEVREVALDPGYKDIRNGLSPWLVLMLRDGTTESVIRRAIDSYLIGPSNANLWKRTQAPAYKGKGIPDALQVTAWARTETHAIKIANEFRTRMIAAGEW